MSTVANQDERKTTTTPQPPLTAQKYVSPEVNIYENEQGYVLQAELPGVTKAGLDITVEGTTLTLVGHREKVALPGEALYRESSAAAYRRLFALDPAIDTTKIDAKLEQGVLTVRLPKSEARKPRKVSVAE